MARNFELAKIANNSNEICRCDDTIATTRHDFSCEDTASALRPRLDSLLGKCMPAGFDAVHGTSFALAGPDCH